MQTIERIILMLLSVFFFTSCSHYIINKDGYIRPPTNYKFSYKRNSAKLTDNNIVDTSAIYYLHNSDYNRQHNVYTNKDEYIRFYSDGMFKMQETKDYPKVEDINNVNKGIVGYYKLKGKIVKLQIYGDIDGGSDQLEFGLIDNDGSLILLNENPRSNFCIGYSEKAIKRKIEKISYLNPKKYEKVKIKGLTYEKPNW